MCLKLLTSIPKKNVKKNWSNNVGEIPLHALAVGLRIVTVGTIYQDTKIPLQKWFLATYILAVHSKGISSLQLASWLGVTQKTA
eukprot:gene8803-8894_t